jgi:hypothetical protein
MNQLNFLRCVQRTYTQLIETFRFDLKAEHCQTIQISLKFSSSQAMNISSLQVDVYIPISDCSLLILSLQKQGNIHQILSN